MISRDLLHTYFCQGRLCCCQHIHLVKDEPVFTRQCYMLKFYFKHLKNHKADKQKGEDPPPPKLSPVLFQNEFYFYTFFKTLFCIAQSKQCLTKLCKENGAKHTKIPAYILSFPMQIKNPQTLSFIRHWSMLNRFTIAIALSDQMENYWNAYLFSIIYSKRHPVLPQLKLKIMWGRDSRWCFCGA